MTPLFFCKQIRAIERAAFKKRPSFEWMVLAGKSVAREAGKMLGKDKRPLLVVAGPGNNGGDAFIAAVELHAGGRKVRTVFYGDEKKLSADAKRALAQYRQSVGEPGKDIKDDEYALVIDGLFGIGLSRLPGPKMNKAVRLINCLACPVLAIDTPSGLCADSGRTWGDVVPATRTLSFFGAKPGLYTGMGVEAVGEVLIDNLGFSESVGYPAAGALLRMPSNLRILSRRPNTHKGDYGTLAVIGGDTGMVGALVLATRAAVRMGAGKVYALSVAADTPAFDPLAPEVMWRQLTKAPFAKIWDGCDCLAVGVGLGTGAKAEAVAAAAYQSSLPLIADADALNLLAKKPRLLKIFKARKADTVITPHPAEAARLLGCSVFEVQQDRIKAALALAKEFKAQVLLKGAGSVLAEPEGRWAICATGNPGLAQAGSGDVLLGMTAALLAQSNDSGFAIATGALLHGVAAV